MNNYYTSYLPIPMDLHGRALLGIHFLTHSLDKRYGYLPNIWAIFETGKVFARHDFADFGDLTSRYLESLYLAKCMTGSSDGEEEREALEKLFLFYFSHGDGLSYRPPIKEPFYSETGKRPYQADMAEGFDQSRVMFALITWFMITHENQPSQLFDKLIEGIRSKAVIKDNYMYFEQPSFSPEYHPDKDAPAYPQQLYFAGTMVMPLVKWYELTGNELALDTARRLVSFITRDAFYFGPEGSFESLRATAPGSWDFANGHTHSRLGTIAGILKYGNLMSDKQSFEFGRKAFDWFYDNYCLSNGWCPEFLGRYPIEQEGCETCTLMDIIECCLQLCAAGHEKYWDIIERLVRNQLLEQQITDASFIPSSKETSSRTFESYPISGDAVLGGFGGWCGVNDFIGNNVLSRRLMHCCGPSGIKAIYLAWHNALKWENGTLRINLLFSRRSRYADIKSFDPAEGRVEVTVRQNCNLELRLPEWVDKQRVRIQINGRNSECHWSSLRLVVGGVSESQQVIITYPLRETVISENVSSLVYETRWRGDTVISISPPGKHVPLYQRDRLIEADRKIVLPEYVPETEIEL